MKPLGTKCYGSIPHLPKSRLGKGDHCCSIGQARIATEKARDKHDLIIVQEKLDGSNVGVAKINGILYPLNRSGHIANSSPYEQHHLFYNWVMQNYERFDGLLNEGERACGEWLAQAHSTRYNLSHEPWVLFDIIKVDDRITYSELKERAKKQGFITPNTIHVGSPLSVEEAMEKLKVSGHGALDAVEGAVWRIERKGKVEFLGKFVRHDKKDGIYFPENNGGKIIWNWRPEWV